jgi:hypothetical protein
MLFSLRAFHDEIGRAAPRWGLSCGALHSLLRNAHVAHMKRTSHALRSRTMRHVTSYLNGTSVVALARKCNYPPSMMARLVVDNVARCPASAPSASGGGGGGGGANARKKFVTEALRHPERMLGCASAALLPEYLFSEKNGATTARGRTLLDPFSQKPLYDADVTRVAEEGTDPSDHRPSRPAPLSRLCVEVREAVDSDPLYGES